MRYVPVLNTQTNQWAVGASEDFKARPLTRDEIEKVCNALNGLRDLISEVKAIRGG
ncbi:MAG: hypothetical protein WC683_03880 [bacterium]